MKRLMDTLRIQQIAFWTCIIAAPAPSAPIAASPLAGLRSSDC
jgi:hypothetical protein